MTTTYLHTFHTSDGESHIEELDLGMLPTGQEGEWRSPYKDIDSLSFRRVVAGWYADWHVAPCRQYIIMLHGEAEIEMSDGEVRRLPTGGILPAEDTEGKGHIRRSIGTEERLSISIPLEPGK
jgi:hypothetical protein